MASIGMWGNVGFLRHFGKSKSFFLLHSQKYKDFPTIHDIRPHAETRNPPLGRENILHTLRRRRAGLSVQLAIMKRLYKSSKRIQITWDELILIDDMNQDYQSSQSNPMNQHRFLPLNSDDDDDDEQIQFDGAALLRKDHSEQIQMNSMILSETSSKNKAKTSSSNSSNTSSTSGHSSALASCCSEPK
jgi:hypothetical protein